MCSLALISWTLISMEFDTTLTAFTFVLIAVFFFGLKEVAVKMTDPFGDDDIDFDIEEMLASWYKNCVLLLKDVHTPLGHHTTVINPLECELDCFAKTAEKCELREKLMGEWRRNSATARELRGRGAVGERRAQPHGLAAKACVRQTQAALHAVESALNQLAPRAPQSDLSFPYTRGYSDTQA